MLFSDTLHACNNNSETTCWNTVLCTATLTSNQVLSTCQRTERIKAPQDNAQIQIIGLANLQTFSWHCPWTSPLSKNKFLWTSLCPCCWQELAATHEFADIYGLKNPSLMNPFLWNVNHFLKKKDSWTDFQNDWWKGFCIFETFSKKVHKLCPPKTSVFIMNRFLWTLSFVASFFRTGSQSWSFFMCLFLHMPFAQDTKKFEPILKFMNLMMNWFPIEIGSPCVVASSRDANNACAFKRHNPFLKDWVDPPFPPSQKEADYFKQDL